MYNENKLKIQDKYVPILNISKEGIINAGNPISTQEIREKENTYEFVQQCDNLIKKTINILNQKNIPYTNIVITSNMGAYYRLDYFYELQEFFQENNQSKEKLENLIKSLHIKTFIKIIPVTFKINTSLTKIKQADYNDLPEESINGIINWEKFIEEIESLGYKIELFNDKRELSFFNYIMVLKQNNHKKQINIIKNNTKKRTLKK